MNSWVSYLMSLVATRAAMAEVPQGDGGTASGEGAQQGAGAPKKEGAAGVGAGASEGGAASPKLASIQDTMLYAGVDPRNPDRKVLGSQVREAFHRADQVDSFQSQLHKTKSEKDAMAAELEMLRKNNEDMQFQLRLENKLKDKFPGQQAQQMPQVNQFGVNESIYTEDPWGLGDLNEPGQKPVQEPGGQRLDINQLADMFRTIAREEYQKQVGDASKDIESRVDSTITAVERQRQAREMTAQTFQRSNDSFSESLRKINTDPTEIQRILEMHNRAFEGMKEAEMLLSDTGPNAQASWNQAQLIIAEANNLRNEAAKAHADAIEQYRAESRKQEAVQKAQTPYAGVDVSVYENTSIESRQKFKPNDAEAAKKNALEKAIEIADEQARLRKTIGG